MAHGAEDTALVTERQVGGGDMRCWSAGVHSQDAETCARWSSALSVPSFNPVQDPSQCVGATSVECGGVHKLT